MMSIRNASPMPATARGSERGLGALAGLLVTALAVCGMACEDKAIGRACDVQAPDAGALQAVYNAQALECPSRTCIKPARDSTVARQIDTGPYCTAECSKDGDCEGETRSAGNPKGCKLGFACAVAFEVGPLRCKKLCLCKDYLDLSKGSTRLQTPASCENR